MLSKCLEIQFDHHFLPPARISLTLSRHLIPCKATYGRKCLGNIAESRQLTLPLVCLSRTLEYSQQFSNGNQKGFVLNSPQYPCFILIKSSFQRFLRVQVIQPYSCSDMPIAWKNAHFWKPYKSDFQKICILFYFIE